MRLNDNGDVMTVTHVSIVDGVPDDASMSDQRRRMAYVVCTSQSRQLDCLGRRLFTSTRYVDLHYITRGTVAMFYCMFNSLLDIFVYWRTTSAFLLLL